MSAHEPHGHGAGPHGHGPPDPADLPPTAHLAPPGEPPGFFDKPGNVRILLRAFYVLSGLLVLVDFIYHRHLYHPWEGLPAFYPLYGFVGIVILVLVAKLLRKAVMRPEDYYDVG